MIQQQKETKQHHALFIRIVPIGQHRIRRTLHFSRRHAAVAAADTVHVLEEEEEEKEQQ